MLRYLDPLMGWLEEQNKGRKATLADLQRFNSIAALAAAVPFCRLTQSARSNGSRLRTTAERGAVGS
jgi:hypothetical protein